MYFKILVMPARRLAWVTHASKFVHGGSSGTIQPVLNVSATHVKLHASTFNFEILIIVYVQFSK